MLRHLRPILRSLSFLSALWKHNIKQIDFKGFFKAHVWSHSRSLLFHAEERQVLVSEENSDYLCLGLQKHFRNIIGRLLAVSQMSRYEQQRFLLAGAQRLLHKAFESTISGHVCTARIENRWPSPDRSWTCLFGMNTMYDHWRSSKSPPTSPPTKGLLNELVISTRLNAAVCVVIVKANKTNKSG